MADSSVIRRSLRIGCILMLICGLVAGVVALVNEITYDTIEANLAAERKAAIIDIFGSETLAYEAVENCPDTVVAVYRVTDGGTALGYCVNLNSGGFGGDINMMVGVGEDGTIVGVTIVSLSETAGLGSRVNDAAYLAQYIGKGGSLVFKTDIDGITGATISSKAVLSGVNMAMAALETMGLAGGVSK